MKGESSYMEKNNIKSTTVNNENKSQKISAKKHRYKKEKMSHEKKLVLGIIFGIIFVTVVFWGTSILGKIQLDNNNGNDNSIKDPSSYTEDINSETDHSQPENSQETNESETENSENETTSEESSDDNSDSVTNDTSDFSSQLPLSEAVDDSYFDDAVFMGDSRTEGFALYSGLSNFTCYASRGLNVSTVFTEPVIDLNGTYVTAVEAMQGTSFSKLYLMFGINETGWLYEEYFIDGYGDIIDAARQTNPNAIIYIQSILPVSKEVSDTNESVNMDKINHYNDLLRQLAQEKQVYFVNCGEAMTDSQGYLPDDAATDGIHLGVEYCDIWLEYLKTHTA